MRTNKHPRAYDSPTACYCSTLSTYLPVSAATQGEDRDTRWGLYIISFYFRFMIGIVFMLVAVAWIAHIVVYMIIDPPLHPLLNDAFKALDDVFPLFGVLLFTIFCSYLICKSRAIGCGGVVCIVYTVYRISRV